MSDPRGVTRQAVASIATDPELLAGWEPHAPTDDTLLRRYVRNLTESLAAPATAMGGRTVRRDDVIAVDVGRPAGLYNFAVLQQPLPLEHVADMAEGLAQHFGDGTGEVWLFSPWPTPDLRAFGWTLAGHPPLMLRPATPGVELPDPLPSLDVAPVTGGEDLRDLERVAIEGYPLPELEGLPAGSLLAESAIADDRMRSWVGREQGQPVAAAMAFVDAGLVHVSLVATLPAARRHGYGAALTWHATLSDPNLPAVLLSSDAGRGVYERMGYVALLRFTAWQLLRGGGR